MHAHPALYCADTDCYARRPTWMHRRQRTVLPTATRVNTHCSLDGYSGDWKCSIGIWRNKGRQFPCFLLTRDFHFSSSNFASPFHFCPSVIQLVLQLFFCCNMAPWEPIARQTCRYRPYLLRLAKSYYRPTVYKIITQRVSSLRQKYANTINFVVKKKLKKNKCARLS